MKIQSATFSILRHVMAGVSSSAFLIVVAIATYFICAAIGNDAGGPMVLFLIPLFAVIGGICTPLMVYFPFSILFGWLSRKARVPFWIAPLIFYALSFLFFVGWGLVAWKRLPSLGEFGLSAICGLFFTGGFTIYWIALGVGQRMFGRNDDAA